MFHMEKLMPNMKLRQDYDFEDYAMKLWMKDKVVYGSYWEHINVCIRHCFSTNFNFYNYYQYHITVLVILISSQDGWKYRENPNFRFVWYEDMIADLPNVIKELANFTGYEVIMCKILLF